MRYFKNIVYSSHDNYISFLLRYKYSTLWLPRTFEIHIQITKMEDNKLYEFDQLNKFCISTIPILVIYAYSDENTEIYKSIYFTVK